jgi:hypothetical protein
MSKLSVVVEAFKPMRSNTLYGFITIPISELHLRIADLTAHEKNGRRWVGLPAKPQIDRSGTARKGENGKPLYTPVLEFTDKATRAHDLDARLRHRVRPPRQSGVAVDVADAGQ